MYGACMFNVPWGFPRRRLKEDGYKVSYSNKEFHQFRQAELVLAFLAHRMGVDMRTNLNFQEFKSRLCKKAYRTDGEFLQYCPTTKQCKRIGVEVSVCVCVCVHVFVRT